MGNKSVWSCRYLVCLVTWLALAGPLMAAGPAPAEIPQAVCGPDATNCITYSEQWVKDQVGKGQRADLNIYCDGPDAWKAESCGRLRPRFVRDLIAATAADDKAAPNGITLRHAMICEGVPPPRNSPEVAATGSGPSICDETYPFVEDDKGVQHPHPFIEDVRQAIHDRSYPLDLRDLRSKVAIDLMGNHLQCDLQLGGAYLEQVLNLDNTVIDGSVDAHHLRVDASITMYNATIHGDVEADGLRTGGSITLYRSQIFGALHMRGAIIGGDVDFGRIIVLGPWPVANPYSIRPERGSVGTPRSGVDLSNTRVGRQLFMSGASVPASDVDLSGVVVEGSVWLTEGTTIPWLLKMERSVVGDSVMLGGSSFNAIDLSGAIISRDLRLETGGYPVTWIGGRFTRDPANKPIPLDKSNWLVLSNARIGAIRDTPQAWPDCVRMAGLVYERAPHAYGQDRNLDIKSYRWCRRVESADGEGRYETSAPPGSLWDLHDWTLPNWPFVWSRPAPPLMHEAKEIRSVVWWRNWLERDPEPSVESYSRLATTLGNVGFGDSADAIRFEQRIFERDGHGLKFLFGCLEEVLIGFGIGTYALAALFWTVLLTGIFTWLLLRRMRELHNYKTAQEKRFWWCWFASLQTLLPLVTLSKQMDDFLHAPVNPEVPSTQPLRGWLAIGFSFLAFMGLVLSGFLLNGLRSYAGL